ncbi:putative polyketide synthase [Trichoderma ceciliae]
MAPVLNDNTSVAITGLSCRFPGDGDNPSNYWNLICEGRSAWSEIPKERFHGDAFWSGGKKRHGSVSKSGHFLKHDISQFDANFFNISGAEANAMDPQHRIALEVVYEALESAGYSIQSLAGTRTGVFMGHFTSDYKELVIGDTDAVPPYATTGLNKTSLANRISWTFDLRGPSFTLDTACSSSLVALHLACQSLRVGESDIAIVGGTNVLLNPDMFVAFSGQGFLSPDGKCKSFDVSGDGYGRGEGVAAVVLKRIDDAIVALDPLRAIIRATGSNQDGHTKSLTLPSADAQEALIRDVYRLAGLDFDHTSYVEAHGTGTQAGDTTETLALSRTIAKGRSPSNRLIVGSVKANIGHLEAASGLAGVIKSVLMLERGLIPPNIHFDNPNPMIEFDNWNLQIPTHLMKWPNQGNRRISINSFGYGGTNAHVILDDAYSYIGDRGLQGLHYTKPPALVGAIDTTYMYTASCENDDDDDDIQFNSQTNTPRIFVLTAQDRDGLARMKKSLASWLHTKIAELEEESDRERFLADLAHTLSDKRSRLQWKSFAIASSLDELADALALSGDGWTEVMSSSVPRLGFVFTGQGAQWATMGMGLMVFPEFSASIEAADVFLRKRLGCPWSPRAELSRGKGTSRLGLALYSQTLCTVLQVALVDLLRTWAIVPDAVVGHSSGEIAAAYCAGYLSREDAWKIAYCRGVVCSNMKVAAPDLEGAMMAVGASPDTCSALIKRVCPEQGALQEQNIFTRRLLIDTAYHSKHMQLVAQDYVKAIADIQPRTTTTSTSVNGTCKMYSSVTESEVTADDLGPEYWVRNLVSPVKFATAIQDLMRPQADRHLSSGDAVDILVEIGPHAALQGPVTQSLQAVGIINKPYLSAIVRNQSAVETALSLVGTLIAHGRPLELASVNRTHTSRTKTLVSLPSYPWNHAQQYWAESRMTRAHKDREASASSLLGAPVPTFSEGDRTWRGFLRLSEEPWVADHKIQEAVLYPGAGFLAMAIEAALQSADVTRVVTGFHLRDIEFLSAMLISESDELEHTINLRPQPLAADDSMQPWTEFIICSSPDRKALVRNCHGLIRVCYDESGVTEGWEARKEPTVLRYQQATESCKTTQQSSMFYQELNDLGFCYGSTFANVTEVLSGDGKSCGTVTIPSVGLDEPSRPHVIHPATLDAIFHLAFAAANSSDMSRLTVPMVPKSMDEMYISIDIPYLEHTKLKGFSNAHKLGFRGQLNAEIAIMDENVHQSVLEISGLHCAEIARANGIQKTSTLTRKICSKLVWRPAVNLLSSEEIQRIIPLSRGLATKSLSTNQAAPPIIQPGCEQLSEYIEILHHTSPGLRIVELSEGTSLLSQDVNISQDVLRTANYALLGFDGNTRLDFENSPTAIKEDEADAPPVNDDLFQKQAGTTDLIICSAISLAPATVARNARLLLKNGGRICTVESLEHILAAKSVLQAAGFTDLFQFGGSVPEEPVFLVGSTEAVKINSSNGSQKKSDITIIQPINPKQSLTVLSTHLKVTLSALGYGASVHTWGVDDISALRDQHCVSLLEVQSTFLEVLEERDFHGLQTLVTQCKSLLWVDALDGASKGLVTGLARVLRNEIPGSQLRTFHFPSATLSNSELLSELICRVVDWETPDNEFRVYNDVIYTSRVVDDENISAEIGHRRSQGVDTITTALKDVDVPLELTMRNNGTVCFRRDDAPMVDLEDDEVEMTVKATAFSSDDMMVGIDELLAFETAGVIDRVGSKVTKFRPGDSVVMYGLGLVHRTVQRSKQEFCHFVPSGYTFEQAISSTAAHAAAWYALERVARVQRGQSILVNAAAGSIGQAAIQIARHFDVEIYAAIESETERDLLRDTYDIPNDYIFSIRDSHFVASIRRMTNGRGVDVVLGSPARAAHRQTSRCLAPFGTFVEIGLRDGVNKKMISTPFVPQDATFSSFSLNHIARKRPELMAEILRTVFDLQQRGITKLINPLKTFPVCEVDSAAGFEQIAAQTETTVLSFSGNDLVPATGYGQGEPIQLDLQCDACYVLVGGLGGLGRSLATMLAENGARKLCFLSRSGAASASAKDLLGDLEGRGVQAQCFQCDVSDISALKHVIDRCSVELGPVRGVIQCAMVLRDTLFVNMSYTQWRESTLPKVQGTQNLHATLPDIDFFVTLGSFAGTFGNRGQSNYAAGCAYQDELALQRREMGKKATTLDVGLMRDIGVLAETGMTDNLKDWEEPYGVREDELRDLVKLAIAGRLPAQVLTGLATGGSAVAAGIPPPFYLADAKFSIMAMTDLDQAVNSNGINGTAKSDPIGVLVSKSESLPEATEHVVASLVSRVAKMLQIAEENVDTARALHSYGLDSLVAIEIVDWALKEVEARVSVFDVMAAVPITATAAKIVNASALFNGEG